MIEYLEYKLKNLYTGLENNSTINYQEVKEIKDTIDRLKWEILKGVQIRSKIQEMKYGEMPSSFLVSKLRGESTKNTIYKLVAEEKFEDINTGDFVEKTQKIEKYATNYYKKLYHHELNDSLEQNVFLNSLEINVSNSDNESLTAEIECSEFESVLKSVESKKSPGIDGIPYEFYQSFWDIIKVEFQRVIAVMKNYLILSESQHLAVISLQPKDGDKHKLSNWRLISLMCCDYKILSKVISNRFKLLLRNLISKEQFCCPGKNNCRQ